MALPEYGRNVQKMVDHIKTIEDRDERNRAAKTIIQIMGNLNTHLRDVGDFKHKLWDHLSLIANFELDIDSPYPVPEPSKFVEKPKQVPYRQGEIRYLHYGRIIELMINCCFRNGRWGRKRVFYKPHCQPDEEVIHHLEQRAGCRRGDNR